MEIVDIVLFNNELHLLDLRVNIIGDIVDKIIVKEATHTFQGDLKECLASTYSHPKVFVETVEFPEGLTTWQKEHHQRAIPLDLKKYGIDNDAVILTSDLDEIPDPKALLWLKENFDPQQIYAFEQKMYQYYLNVRNLSEYWIGTKACSVNTYNRINAEILRSNPPVQTVLVDAGWHWTFLGGKDIIEHKIKSYSHEEHDNEETLSQIKIRMDNNEDIFNRGYKLEVVEIDETYPMYIQNNKDKLSSFIR